MNHREPPHQAAGLRRALRYVSLLLLPTLVPKSVSGVSRTGPNAGAALDLGAAEPVLLPYLAAIGGPPLRFQPAPPHPDLSVRPTATVPPIPTAPPPDAPVVATAAPLPAPKPISTPATPTVAAPTDLPATADKAAPEPAKESPPAILPDDARPSIRPEDFLPYFQIPGSGKPGDVNLLVPASALRGASGSVPVPPSSATYTQSK